MSFDVVILGLGYVGLPLAQQAIRAGMTVLGFDVNTAVVDALGAGRSHVDDLSDADVAEMLAGGFRTTADETRIAEADTAVICVPTPLSEGDGPDLRAVSGNEQTIAGLHAELDRLLASTAAQAPAPSAAAGGLGFGNALGGLSNAMSGARQDGKQPTR